MYLEERGFELTYYSFSYTDFSMIINSSAITRIYNLYTMCKQTGSTPLQVMRVSRSNESLQIKVRELEEVDHFECLGSVLTRDSCCTREIKMRIAIAKEAFNRKMSLLTSKRNIELKNKLVRCYVWSIALMA